MVLHPLPLTSHWTQLGHVATTGFRVGWEMESDWMTTSQLIIGFLLLKGKGWIFGAKLLSLTHHILSS